MKIDKEFLEGQIEQFGAQKTQLEADFNATIGAIQLCHHLLEVLKMKSPKEEEKQDSPPPKGKPKK